MSARGSKPVMADVGAYSYTAHIVCSQTAYKSILSVKLDTVWVSEYSTTPSDVVAQPINP